MTPWATSGPAVTAAFLASLVEVVEAFTIVLAVETDRGFRPAALGTISGLALLVAIVLTLGPVLEQAPVQLLQFIIGVLLLLFGLRWLRKAILRAAHIIPWHDEEATFTTETARLETVALEKGNTLICLRAELHSRPSFWKGSKSSLLLLLLVQRAGCFFPRALVL